MVQRDRDLYQRLHKDLFASAHLAPHVFPCVVALKVVATVEQRNSFFEAIEKHRRYLVTLAYRGGVGPKHPARKAPYASRVCVVIGRLKCDTKYEFL